MSAKHLIPVFLLGAIGGTARADAVADFTAGTIVLVRGATVDFGGPRTHTGIALRKRAGTLDFDLAAADLGVDNVPITFHLHGTALGGGRILFTVDQRYSPVLALPDRHWLARASGQLSALAMPLPGTVGTADGNVQLTLAGASSLVAEGDWGTLTIAVTQLDLIGGVPQPALAGFADAGGGLLCSDRVATARPLTVWLADVAQGRGAVVQLAGPRAGGVRVPDREDVRLGQCGGKWATAIPPA